MSAGEHIHLYKPYVDDANTVIDSLDTGRRLVEENSVKLIEDEKID